MRGTLSTPTCTNFVHQARRKYIKFIRVDLNMNMKKLANVSLLLQCGAGLPDIPPYQSIGDPHGQAIARIANRFCVVFDHGTH